MCIKNHAWAIKVSTIDILSKGIDGWKKDRGEKTSTHPLSIDIHSFV